VLKLRSQKCSAIVLSCPFSRLMHGLATSQPVLKTGFFFAVKVSRQMKQIELRGKYGQGKFAIVDDVDYEHLVKIKWYANLDGYAVKRSRWSSESALMHRYLMGTPDGLQVDHINGDRLDNRRCNLRLCNTAQNNRNMRPGARKGSSRFKGVHWCTTRRKWCAMIKDDHRRYNLGRFSSEIEAARAYDRKASELFGEFFRPNFPEEAI